MIFPRADYDIKFSFYFMPRTIHVFEWEFCLQNNNIESDIRLSQNIFVFYILTICLDISILWGHSSHILILSNKQMWVNFFLSNILLNSREKFNIPFPVWYLSALSPSNDKFWIQFTSDKACYLFKAFKEHSQLETIE